MGVEKGHKYIFYQINLNLYLLNEIESGCIKQTFFWGLNVFLYKALTWKMKYLYSFHPNIDMR